MITFKCVNANNEGCQKDPCKITIKDIAENVISPDACPFDGNFTTVALKVEEKNSTKTTKKASKPNSKIIYPKDHFFISLNKYVQNRGRAKVNFTYEGKTTYYDLPIGLYRSLFKIQKNQKD